MATTIKTKHSNTTGTTPTGLVTGELAVNTVDKKMWIGNGSTEVVLIGNKLSGIEAAEASSGGFLVGDGTKFVVETEGTARTSLGLGSLATESVVNLSSQVTNTLSVGNGGTGATSFTAGAILRGAGSGALDATGVTIDSNDILTFGTKGFIIPKATGSNPTSATAGQFFSDISTGRLNYNASSGTTESLAYTREIPAAANDGTLTLATSGTGITLGANKTFSANQSSNVTITITSDATSSNSANAIVARDASGNFSAGTISAALTGNASTATKWATPRTITLTGDVTGTSGNFDGSGNLSFSTTIPANSIALGTQTSGNYVGSIEGTDNEIEITEVGDAGGEGGAYTIGLPNSVQITSNLTVGGNLIVQGTTTTVNSTTVTLDDPIITLGGDTAPTTNDAKDRGVEFRYYDTAARLGFMGYDNSAGNFVLLTNATNTSEVFTGTKGTLVADLTGVASSATALVTSRNFSITGDITASAVGFNGTSAVTLNASIAAGVVGTTELADDAVTNAKIANNAVTLGTQTSGNYVASVSAGTGISVSGTGEGAAVAVNLNHLGIQSLTDPNDDRVIFWDDDAGSTAWLTLGNNLSITGTTLNATDTNTTYSADGTTLTLTGTTFSINSTYAGQTSITTLGTVETGTINGGTF